MPTVYYCPETDYTPPDTEHLRTLLDSDELARYRRMREPVGARFFQARLMVKTLLAEHLGLAPGDIRFDYSDNGKPTLTGASQRFFSISHCNSSVAVAISRQPVGVDVEQVHRRRGKLEPPWQNPEVFLHPHTAAWVHAAEEQHKPLTFTLLWTLLESQVKLTDTSIVRASRHLQIDLNTQQQPWQARICAGEEKDSVNWNACTTWGNNEEVLSVAFSSAREVRFMDWKSAQTMRPHSLIG